MSGQPASESGPADPGRYRPGAGSQSTHPGWPPRLVGLQVERGRIVLRAIRASDARQWSRARIRDERYLRPWEPTASLPWTVQHRAWEWPGLCARLRKAARRGSLLPMVIEVDGAYAGQLTVGNVVRGPLRSAWVGYWVRSDFAGGGVASGALALAVDHCFGPVGLHRLEATVRPENAASRAVLSRVGFREEGFLRRYMDVDGEWRDHLLTAMTVDEHQDSAASRLVRSGRARWC